MKNNEFKVGSHILIYGNKGIVTDITKCKEYKLFFDEQEISTSTFTEDAVSRMIEKGYVLQETGRTATYFDVSFANEECLKGTAYDGGCFGCLDEYENYGTW